jgi:hypothetical protein
MTQRIEVDLWVRGQQHATTRVIGNVAADPAQWTDTDVQQLLTEMLLALEREKNPGGDPPFDSRPIQTLAQDRPRVTLRGFNWIVSPDDKSGGVIVHMEMQMGTASAGPFAIDEQRLVAMIQRVVQPAPSERVH